MSLTVNLHVLQRGAYYCLQVDGLIGRASDVLQSCRAAKFRSIREIHQNTQNTRKIQIHVNTTYLKLISTVGALYKLLENLQINLS